MTTTITVDRYQAWFSITTIHGSNLEFVLTDTAESKDLDRDVYTDDLQDRLKEQFKDEPNVGVIEYQGYGDISFLVTAPTPGELEAALRFCAFAARRWARAHGVDRMKGKTP